MSLDACILRFGRHDGGAERVVLGPWLRPQASEAAERDANAWIKALRHARVDGVALRDRFTYRGDSLWWFAELYLHKRRVVVDAFRAILALEALAASTRPAWLEVVKGTPLEHHVASELARREGLEYRGSARRARPDTERRRLSLRGRFHTLTALADRLRPNHRPPAVGGPVDVAAFVHTAFWRPDSRTEGYLGPVLRETTGRLGAERVSLVGLGPRTNFRARGWRQRLTEFRDPQARSAPIAPVETFTSWRDMRPSGAIWRSRKVVRRALEGSEDLRRAALVRGCDLWPFVNAEIEGIADLQFPWSARAMDEAGAALDRLKPACALTYAEAGGWGRALVLEARRRGIPVVALQHGFIYRHWLNYLHEPDEMQPSPVNLSDRGFPRPDLTLVYDRFAARHLREAGRFPGDSLEVTGNPRVQAFAEAGALTDEARAHIRRGAGASEGQQLVVVATKYAQAARVFPELVRAVAAMPDVHLVVKCHPAETEAPYRADAAGVGNVSIASSGADLGALTAAARLIVTVNSTAAIEAMALDVPALVLDLPNNLSPFVEAGAVAGVEAGQEIAPCLKALLYDEDVRRRMGERRRSFMEQYEIVPRGPAAVRAAEAIVRVARDARAGAGPAAGAPPAAAAAGRPS